MEVVSREGEKQYGVGKTNSNAKTGQESFGFRLGPSIFKKLSPHVLIGGSNMLNQVGQKEGPIRKAIEKEGK